MTATAAIGFPSGRTSPLLAKLRREDGIGLVELLIALLVLNIGIFATLAAFTSGALAIRRASHTSTAAAIADQQMEKYRDSTYASIPPASTPPTCPAMPYTSTSTVTGADGRSYTVVTTASCGTQQSSGASAQVKQVTLTITDPNDHGKTLVTSSSTFSRCTQGVLDPTDTTPCQS